MMINYEFKKKLAKLDFVCKTCGCHLSYEIYECEIIIEPCDVCLDEVKKETREEVETEFEDHGIF